MNQQDIDLRIYRGRLEKSHQKYPEIITQEMIREFMDDVASGDQKRKTLAAGRAEKWLARIP